jgi:RimJ/RimL family protein N-acetyltransferase
VATARLRSRRKGFTPEQAAIKTRRSGLRRIDLPPGRAEHAASSGADVSITESAEKAPATATRRHDWERITTRRLELVTLPAAALRAIADGDMAAASRHAGCDLADFPLEQRDIAEMRLADLARDPDYLPWSLRALCLRSEGLTPEGRFVGYFNFHSRPDPEYLRPLAPNAVELGYHILPAYRRQGFAAEAAHGMMDWAHGAFGIRRFVVSISPGNLPSMAMARKLGFIRIGEHMDEEDGYEEVLALDRPA